MTKKVTNGLDLQNQRIQNLGDGTAATDAITKQQLDAAIRGLDWKPEVVAASTGNVDIAAPGSTLDGVTLTAGMQTIVGIGTVTRVLLKNQTDATQNGIWDWNGAAAALTRSLDADSGAEISGMTVTVQGGTVNGDRVYRASTDDPITIGTTPIAFIQVGAGGGSSYVAGDGLTESPGGTFNVGAGTGVTVQADTVSIDTNVIARKVAGNIGDGVATQFTVPHNLGTRDVVVSVYATDGTGDDVLADVQRPDLNNVLVAFASAPSSGAYRVVVHG